MIRDSDRINLPGVKRQIGEFNEEFIQIVDPCAHRPLAESQHGAVVPLKSGPTSGTGGDYRIKLVLLECFYVLERQFRAGPAVPGRINGHSAASLIAWYYNFDPFACKDADHGLADLGIHQIGRTAEKEPHPHPGLAFRADDLAVIVHDRALGKNRKRPVLVYLNQREEHAIRA